MKDTTYSIKSASALTNLNAHTIRAWERRYKALEPGRQVNGRRLYLESDVQRLRLLSSLVNAGHSISSIAALSDDVLESMLQPTKSSDDVSQDAGCQVVLNHCLEALQKYQLQEIHQELEAARVLLSAKSFVLNLALPLLTKVGEMVSRDVMCIAHEHALSAIIRSILLQILYNVRSSVSSRSYTRKDLAQGLVVAVAAPEGDLHEFGILAAAIIVASYGHNPHFFGANMPARALADAANAIRSDIVLLGLTHIPDSHRIQSDEAYASELQENLRTGANIWWGGNVQMSSDYFTPRSRHIFFKSLLDLDAYIKSSNHLTPA
jgi:DNA-binding transcriptional MerR regulator